MKSLWSHLLKAFASKAGIIITTATITGSITIWILHQTYEAEISNLNTTHLLELSALKDQMGSIHRRLGDSDSLDVKKLMIQKSEFQKVPIGATYFNAGNFFAITNLDGWQYSLTSYKTVMDLLTGREPNKDVDKIFENSTLYLWRKPQILPIQGSSVLSNLVSFIAVQKLPIDELKDAIGLETAFSMSITNNTTNVMSVSTMTSIPLKKAFPGDVVGVLLASTLDQLFLSTTFISDEVSGEVITLQKVDNVLYGQFRFTLKNATINGVKYEKYYYYLDGMVVGLEPYVYVVVSLIPSEQPTTIGSDFKSVSDWYRNFVILTDP